MEVYREQLNILLHAMKAVVQTKGCPDWVAYKLNAAVKEAKEDYDLKATRYNELLAIETAYKNAQSAYSSAEAAVTKAEQALTQAEASLEQTEEKLLDDTLVEELSAMEHVVGVYPKLNVSVIAKSGKYMSWMALNGMTPEGLASLNLPVGQGTLPEEGGTSRPSKKA